MHDPLVEGRIIHLQIAAFSDCLLFFHQQRQVTDFPLLFRGFLQTSSSSSFPTSAGTMSQGKVFVIISSRFAFTSKSVPKVFQY